MQLTKKLSHNLNKSIQRKSKIYQQTRYVPLLILNTNQFLQILNFITLQDIYTFYLSISNYSKLKFHRIAIEHYLLNFQRKVDKNQQILFISMFCKIKKSNVIINLQKYFQVYQKKCKTSQIIRIDVERTYINNISTYTLKKYLINVLSCIQKQFTHIGYIQGFNYIIRTMYLNEFSQSQSIIFANYLLKQMKLQQLFINNMAKIFEYTYVIEVYLFNYVPKLYQYLQILGIDIIYFTADWLITLFSEHLPLRVINKLWNIFLIKGWKILIKFSLAILLCYQNQIMAKTKQELSTYLKHFLQNDFNRKKQQQIFKLCMSIKVSNKIIYFFSNKMDQIKKDSQIQLCKIRKSSMAQAQISVQKCVDEQIDGQEYIICNLNKNQPTILRNYFKLCENINDVVI